MQKTFEAVYENCILRPLEALRLPDNLRVTVTIEELAASGQDVGGYFSPEGWEAAAHDPISLEEVRRALSSIPGSLSDTVVASREDR